MPHVRQRFELLQRFGESPIGDWLQRGAGDQLVVVQLYNELQLVGLRRVHNCGLSLSRPWATHKSVATDPSDRPSLLPEESRNSRTFDYCCRLQQAEESRNCGTFRNCFRLQQAEEPRNSRPVDYSRTFENCFRHVAADPAVDLRCYLPACRNGRTR